MHTPKIALDPSVLRYPAAVALLLAALPAAQAANGTWTGGTSVTWATTTNWSGGTVAGNATVANADIATFNSASYSFAPTAVNNYFLGGLLFAAGNTGNVTVTTGTANNRLNLGSGGIQMNAGTGAVNIGATGTGGINLTANQNWTNNDDSLLTVLRAAVDDAATTSNGTYTLTINGSGTGGVTVANFLADLASATDANKKLALVINTTGGNTTLAGGAGTYSGGTTLTQGNLVLASIGALGTGSVALNGGKLASSTAAMTITNAITIGGDVALSDASPNTGALTFNGTVDLGAATRTLTLAGNGAVFNGVVSNGGITKAGASTLTLNGASANTYTGLTTVGAGGLTLSKTATVDAIAGDVLVNGTGTLTLGASDQIKNTSNVEVATGGTFALAALTETVNGVKLTGGTITGSAGGVLSSTTAYDFQSSTSVTGSLAGTAGANKTTSGNVTFTGSNANTYTGLTKVSAGSLVLNKPAGVDALAGDVLVNGTGTLTISNPNQIKDNANVEVATGGTFTMGSNAETVNGVKLTGGAITAGSAVLTSSTAFDLQSGSSAAALAGAVAATKTTAGTVILSKANTYNGTTTISGGTLQIGAGGTTGSIDSTTSVTNNAALVYNRSNNLTASYAIGGNGTLEKQGNGTLTLTGSNGYTGTTTITAGALQVGAGSDAGSIASSASIVNNGALVYNVGAGNRTYGNVISGSGSLTQSGNGTLTLSGNNTYIGATNVNAGTLLVNGSTASGSAVNVASGAILGGSGTVGGATTLTSGTIGSAGSTLALGSTLATTGTSTLTANSTVNVAGGTTITSGTFTVDGTLGGGIAVGGSGNILNGSGTIGGNTTVNGGTINGSLSLGTLTATGNSTIASSITTISGTTVQSGGILNVNGGLGGGAVTIDSGATLKGNGIVSGATTINGDLAPGASPGLLSFSDALTLAGTTTMEINDTTRGVGGYDAVDVAGLLTYGGTLTMSFGSTTTAGTTYDLFGINGTQANSFNAVTIEGTYASVGALTNSLGIWTGDDLTNNLHFVFTQSSGDLVVTAIPEPSAYAAFAGLGMVGFALYRRRRQQRVAVAA